MKTRYLTRFLAAIALTLGVVPGVVSSSAAANEGTGNNPTSKFFVVETTGESNVDNGQRIEALTKRSVFSAEGTVIETKAGATDSIVLSNGSALFIGPSTRFEVKKFSQAPFAIEREDLDVEPSISQTFVKILRGSVGICTSKLVAGSSMVYATPQGTINIRGRRLLIVVEDTESRVYLLEGDITVVGSRGGAGETLKPGQFASMRSVTDHSAVISVQPIPDEEISKIDDRIANACMSRRTVYFESNRRKDGRGEGPEELRPVEIVGAKLPTEYTISPSRL